MIHQVSTKSEREVVIRSFKQKNEKASQIYSLRSSMQLMLMRNYFHDSNLCVAIVNSVAIHSTPLLTIVNQVCIIIIGIM